MKLHAVTPTSQASQRSNRTLTPSALLECLLQRLMRPESAVLLRAAPLALLHPPNAQHAVQGEAISRHMRSWLDQAADILG